MSPKFEKRRCGICANDTFEAVVNQFGWLKLRCTDCHEMHDPEEPEDFAE